MAVRRNNSGITVLGVKIGCHAFNLCCLKAVFGGFLDFWSCDSGLSELSLSLKSSAFRRRKKFIKKMLVVVTGLTALIWVCLQDGEEADDDRNGQRVLGCVVGTVGMGSY